jgi:hypothetical protein
MTTQETIQEEVVHCNFVIDPEEFVFSEDDKDGIELNIHDLALLVYDKVAPYTDSAEAWNKYARACIQKGNRNATRSFVLAFQFGADKDDTTKPSDCTCWCLQLPTGEEIILSILPRQKQEDSDRTKKEIQRTLRIHKLHRGFAAWVDSVDNVELVSMTVIVNHCLPIPDVGGDEISSPPQIKRGLQSRVGKTSGKKRKIVLFPPQKKTLIPNPRFVRNPRNLYTPDRKRSTQKQNKEKDFPNPLPFTPDSTQSPHQPTALFQPSQDSKQLPEKQDANKHATKAVPCTPDDTPLSQERTPLAEPSKDQGQSSQKQVLNKHLLDPMPRKPDDTQASQNPTTSSQQMEEKEDNSEQQSGCVCKIINY